LKKYCKSYTLAELRRFPGWSAGVQPEEQEMPDDKYVFLTDVFTVLLSPIDKENILFGEDSPEWRQFCTETLEFKIPEDLAFAYAEPEQGDAAAPTDAQIADEYTPSEDESGKSLNGDAAASASSPSSVSA
jgi:hypothetical protein